MRRWLLTILIIILGFAVGYYLKYPTFSNGEKQEPGEQESQAKVTPSPQPVNLTMAVVIDNSPEARPQFGIGSAEIVMETLAEGGITRLVAFYSNQDLAKIGPVRSVRPYFVDWALGFGVPLAHSGGSWHALQKIQSLKNTFKDIDEFAYERYFWRDKSRRQPHNLFTSSKSLSDVSRRNDWRSVETVYGWELTTNPRAATSTVTEIFIDYSFPTFQVLYQYDPVENNYKRLLAGQPHRDAESGSQIETDNVVLLYTTSTVLDPKPQFLTIDLAATGSGRAVLGRGGEIINGRWRKTSPSAPLELLEADGTKLKLNPGSIWFSMIDQAGSAAWK